MQGIVDNLNKLNELQAQHDLINVEYQLKRLGVIPAEVQLELARLDAEREAELEGVQSQIDTLSGLIKAAVLNLGQTVKGIYLSAVYSSPRVTWDNKGLDGYMAAYPELRQFRKEGKPAVSIRTNK